MLTIQGREVLANMGGCHVLEGGVHVPLEGCTAPWLDSVANPRHVAANEPVRPPEAA